MNKKYIFFILAIIVFSPFVNADNIDTARKIYEASKEVESYQNSIFKGTYSNETSTWVIILYSLIGLVVLSGVVLYTGVLIEELPESFKNKLKILSISIATILLLIFLYQIISYWINEIDNSKRKSIIKNHITETTREYEKLYDQDNDGISIISGKNPKYVAGSSDFKEILNIQNSKEIMINHESAHWKIIECKKSNGCNINIFPINHPFVKNLWESGFYLCKNSQQQYVLTGFYFNYNNKTDGEFEYLARDYIKKSKIMNIFNNPAVEDMIGVTFFDSPSYDYEFGSVEFNTDIARRENLKYSYDELRKKIRSRSDLRITYAKGFSFIWTSLDKNGKKQGINMCKNE